jgi:hypothetical protein
MKGKGEEEGNVYPKQTNKQKGAVLQGFDGWLQRPVW